MRDIILMNQSELDGALDDYGVAVKAETLIWDMKVQLIYGPNRIGEQVSVKTEFNGGNEAVVALYGISEDSSEDQDIWNVVFHSLMVRDNAFA